MLGIDRQGGHIIILRTPDSIALRVPEGLAAHRFFSCVASQCTASTAPFESRSTSVRSCNGQRRTPHPGGTWVSAGYGVRTHKHSLKRNLATPITMLSGREELVPSSVAISSCFREGLGLFQQLEKVCIFVPWQKGGNSTTSAIPPGTSHHTFPFATGKQTRRRRHAHYAIPGWGEFPACLILTYNYTCGFYAGLFWFPL